MSIPGFFTASEAFTAIHAGADYLKLFPAALGPGYVKALKAVVKKPILAVGGVNAANLPDFMKVCAEAGIGSALYKAGKSLDDLDRDAADMVAAVRGTDRNTESLSEMSKLFCIWLCRKTHHADITVL